MTETLTKAIATITEPNPITDADAPYGGFTAVLSTPSTDRDGDRLLQEEWVTPLPARINLDADHEMSVAGTIGSAKPYFDDGGRLMIDATFASTPRAQEVRSLVREGHINSVSVAFMTDKTKKDGSPRRELLNAGVVAIPSNREAVILSAKAVTDFGKLLDAHGVADLKAAGTSDAKLLQAIHDASSLLGASCAEPIDNATGASEGANKSHDHGTVKSEIEVTITPTLSPDARAAFEAEIDAIVEQKTSGLAAGTPQGDSPADPPADPTVKAASDAAPQGPAEVPADDAADAAGDAAGDSDDVAVKARLLKGWLVSSDLALDAISDT